MIAETDLTAKLDALGRALSTSVPLEPPAEFMHAVQHQHRVFVVKRTFAVVAGVVVVFALAYLARNFGSSTPRSEASKGLTSPAPPHDTDSN